MTVRIAWGGSAKEFMRHSESIGYYGALTARLVRAIGSTVAVLMDFGCGYGRVTRAVVAARGRSQAPLAVLLVDNAPEMLALTDDITAPAVRVVRFCDDERLTSVPAEFVGRIDAIACNAAMHLLRDDNLSPSVDVFLSRASDVLSPGGVLVATLPDQAYEFSDGWQSQFHRQAQRLWPDSAARAQLPRFNDELLRRAAVANGLAMSVDYAHLSVTWQDFVSFYSIPALGAERLPGLTQEERIDRLQNHAPLFDAIEYRWAIASFQKPAASNAGAASR